MALPILYAKLWVSQYLGEIESGRDLRQLRTGKKNVAV